ncbi:MAG: nucleotide exchange factor GrpE [Spirochaetales bacterium]|nr:nucleotide exchange factor GrpE [Spirochaetales bacterium]
MSTDEQMRDKQAVDAESETESADGTADTSTDTEAKSGVEESGDAALRAEESAESGPNEQVELTPEERLETRIVELEAENAGLADGLLRKTADFENYRKRMLREKEEFVAYANRELLLDIVSIVDDFERAIRSADESHDFAAFHDGIVMIEKQFINMLDRKWKLARFDSVGEEFDPQRHEAMMTEDRSDHEQSMVLEDFQKGYMLHEKVLRPAKVKVSMPDASGPSKRE